ncbi:MAG TPA: hypothetical protein PKY59_09505, partial [Pyrinomonadaceae bacterium]|nr:hypothetical protein [Pyrinomonadaceae bacterium]
MILGGYIADFARQKSRGGRMFYGAVLTIISVPCWLIALFTNDANVVVACGAILLFVGLAWLGAAAADTTEIAGVNLRGVAVAIYFFTVNIFAYIIGANLIALISDYLGGTQNPQMLRYALLVCPISCLFGGIALILGGRILASEQT